MFTFGDFNHELDYIIMNNCQSEIFSKYSIINGKLRFQQNIKETLLPNKKVAVQKNNSKIINVFGINNYENCCFLNSTLQVILNYPQFVSALRQYEMRSRGSSIIIEKILNYYNQITPVSVDLNISKLQNDIIYFGSKLHILNPCLDLISMLGFVRNQHEDAEEFLTKLLTQIHSDLLLCDFSSISSDASENNNDKWVEIGKKGKNLSPPREDGGEMSTETVLSELVSGKMIEKIFKRNKVVSATATPFFILPLNIQNDDVHDVRSAFSNLTVSEKLSDSSERRMQIGQLPTLLILQLKRFTFSKEVGIEKIQKKISINPILSIPNDCISSTINDETEATYKLCAIVFHIGEGVMKGHYTTAIKDMESWYYIDDSNVYLIQGEQSISWLLYDSSAEIPKHLSLDLKVCSPQSACVSGRRTPYLIFYTK